MRKRREDFWILRVYGRRKRGHERVRVVLIGGRVCGGGFREIYVRRVGGGGGLLGR